ncbi:hypothetical protein GIB67_000692 [Kingdonia uniflora]|uniref:Uncharacterized protein n=1 Tax=Kingdonia uniflora TaxID=39325 RepID=A0A7J7NE09_9MAGN|nr:hypothetical protein GIB67_000692 [Kingdonia uniflora]
MSDEEEKMMISGVVSVNCSRKIGKNCCKLGRFKTSDFCYKHCSKEERSRTKRGDVEREETSSPTCKHKVGRGLCKSLTLQNDEFCRKHSFKRRNSKETEDKENTIQNEEESLLQLENGEENGVKRKKIAREGLDQSLILIDSKRRTRAVNARYKDSDFTEFQLGKRIRVSNSFVSKPRKEVSDKGMEFESNMCHQCQRNDKGQVFRCKECKTKRFCNGCIKW